MSAFNNLFGDFFKEMRMKTGMTLRNFCGVNGLDPGNISKMERGMSPPPQSRDKLEKYADYLRIDKYSEDWYNFFDYAHVASGKISPDIMSDEELVRKMPMVFRTLRGEKVNSDNLDKLVEMIRETD